MAGLVKRGDIYWARLGPAGRRPALVVSPTSAVARRTRVTVAPITRTIRGLRSEVPLGPPEGLSEVSIAACEDLVTIPKALLSRRPAGELGAARMAELDRALVYALGIRLRSDSV